MSDSTPIRVLLVDDSALVRQGIRSVLEGHPSPVKIELVGEAGSVSEAVAAAKELRPNVVLLDIRLPDGFGFIACRDILRDNPDAHVLVLTSFTDDTFIYEAITAGAQGYLMKEIDPAGLVDAIQRVAAGQSVISPDLTARMLAIVRSNSQQANSIFTLLSPQEKKVLELVVQGRTNKEIGEKLNLSENTVKNYLGNVFEKLHVRRRSQAAALFIQSQTTPSRPKRT
ncbi:DNA-binding response regulator [Opitutaceae bacterium EW11]|nr:DNA-binding response regulator [Opitutaceae bacterium EW11]